MAGQSARTGYPGGCWLPRDDLFLRPLRLSVADLSLLGRIQPVLIAIAAPLVLRERLDPRVWLLLAAGVVGTMVLLGPQLAIGNVHGLWAMGAVASSTVAHLSLRVLGRTDRAAAIVLWFQVGGTILALMGVALMNGGLPRLPSPALLPWLAGVGIAGTAGQVLMTRAYALDRADVVSAASHTSPVWAVFADVLLFGLLPTVPTVVGGVILVGAALALLLLPRRAPSRIRHGRTISRRRRSLHRRHRHRVQTDDAAVWHPDHVAGEHHEKTCAGIRENPFHADIEVPWAPATSGSSDTTPGSLPCRWAGAHAVELDPRQVALGLGREQDISSAIGSPDYRPDLVHGREGRVEHVRRSGSLLRCREYGPREFTRPSRRP